MTNTYMLKNAIKKSGYRIYFIANKLKISYQTLQNKMTGKTEFKQNEIFELSELLNLTVEERNEIFFAENVDNTSTQENE